MDYMNQVMAPHRISQGRTLLIQSQPILSASMLLRYSFNMDEAADAVDHAVKQVLKDGYRTVDIMSEGNDKGWM